LRQVGCDVSRKRTELERRSELRRSSTSRSREESEQISIRKSQIVAVVSAVSGVSGVSAVSALSITGFHFQTMPFAATSSLSPNSRSADWFNFHSYLRTASPQKPPSEWVVCHALRHTWPQFLQGSSHSLTLKKFLASKISPRLCAYSDLFQLAKAA